MDYKDEKHGFAALHLVQSKEMIEKLFECSSQIDINAQSNKGETPLHRLVHRGNVEMVEEFLGHHPDTTLLDNNDNTASHYARTPEMRRLFGV